MKSKYIIILDAGIELPVVFNPILNHSIFYKEYGPKIVSAGFCSRGSDGNYSVWGESVTLKIKSRSEDAEIINRLLAYDC